MYKKQYGGGVRKVGVEVPTVTGREVVGMMASGGLVASTPGYASSRSASAKESPMSALASRIAYVGCRTTRERNARGEGIAVFQISNFGRTWNRIQLVDGLLNPSFLCFNHGRRVLYAVHGDSSEVSAFRIDPAGGRLTPISQVPCQGLNPVHLTLDPSGRFLLVANHITRTPHVSSLAVLSVATDGALGGIVDHVPLRGNVGPHLVEQPFAKPHQVVFDPAGRFVAVPDKGLDLILTYRLDDAGKLQAAATPPARAREGSGPRHLAFHPAQPFVFVLNELSSTVLSCAYDPQSGAITPRQEVSALPDTFIGFSRGSEIETSPDGQFVYVSNRGHDSLATFAVDSGTGRLSPVGWVAADGKTPRFFTLDPSIQCLFAANEDSDTIVAFSRDQRSGELSEATVVARTGSPTCILFA